MKEILDLDKNIKYKLIFDILKPLMSNEFDLVFKHFNDENVSINPLMISAQKFLISENERTEFLQFAFNSVLEDSQSIIINCLFDVLPLESKIKTIKLIFSSFSDNYILDFLEGMLSTRDNEFKINLLNRLSRNPSNLIKRNISVNIDVDNNNLIKLCLKLDPLKLLNLVYRMLRTVTAKDKSDLINNLFKELDESNKSNKIMDLLRMGGIINIF